MSSGNYYRTREQNFLDEQQFTESVDSMRIRCPALYIHPSNDMVISRAMAEPMSRLVTNLDKEEVDANHWALLERPGEVNSILFAWLGNK